MERRATIALAVVLALLLALVRREPLPPDANPQPRPLPQIVDPAPPFLDYAGVCAKLREWEGQSAGLARVEVYGRSSQGRDLACLHFGTPGKPRVLFTGCIHGNEPWSTGIVLAYAGNLLAGYGRDAELTRLLDEREFCLVPVVSPDSYPHSRQVDGVDPNRDFPGPRSPNRQSVPPVAALQHLFLRLQPQAALSGHTHGRVLLYPPGDTTTPTQDEAAFARIVGAMAGLCQYRKQHACEMYGRPIYGSEVDWYYRHGAFTVVMEFGTHQQKPSPEQIKDEFARTWASFRHFCHEAPVALRPQLSRESCGRLRLP